MIRFFLRISPKFFKNIKIKDITKHIYTNIDELPKPGSKSQTKTSEGNDIKKILKAPQTEDLSKKSSSSIEDVILEKIKE